MSNYLNLMGWNEILARVFEGFEVQRDASPDWLVNPGTRRRLKLDILYADIGMAVRFVGLQVKGAGRKSEWEEKEDASRDEVRKELCRLHGIDLLLIAPDDAYPNEQFKDMGIALASASRRLAQGERFQGKAAVMERLAQARQRMDEIRRRVNKPEDLALFAEAWRDRELRAVADAQKQASSTVPTNGKAVAAVRQLQIGQQVTHERFGVGTVTQVESKDNDVYVAINFVTAGERRFLASLVADKLRLTR
jgi:hypothetical protein